ncbi:hypothetical protein C8J98_101657 [Luteibacter sp. OK325]|uniref:hypothetical protein n=1 Tax=Luteibacter sp. OK325 TaxID=2135670 RepID=UPI000D38EAA7|nr:hypothetical protein [Luteibacter sp. OK325]PTR35392.1 hypothetical protein C8J98_101657 [Luteibacter sp. OK325]
MTTYQRTAVFILRLVGLVWTVFFAFMWGMYAVELAFGIEVQHYPAHTIIGNVGYIVLGIVIAAASKPLGRLIGSGLDA